MIGAPMAVHQLFLMTPSDSIAPARLAASRGPSPAQSSAAATAGMDQGAAGAPVPIAGGALSFFDARRRR